MFMNMEIIKTYIEKNIDSILNIQSKTSICKALTSNGTRCKYIAKHNELCNKHYTCKNVICIKERKQFTGIYHNHAPINKTILNCPKCALIKHAT